MIQKAGGPARSQEDSVLPMLEEATRLLLLRRNPCGHWEGCLADSALSTATAAFALAKVDQAHKSRAHQELVRNGLSWLARNQNFDGGWGDTVLSPSNISTTALAWAALSRAPSDQPVFATAVSGARRWLNDRAGSLDPELLAAAISRRYGKDRTFSVPILSMCALSGRLGRDREVWRRVTPLPFQLAALPRKLFPLLRLPVVSYALPALITIGQLRHHFLPVRNPIGRFLRYVTRRRTLSVLEEIQPKGGGFLEAAPLTSFVVMSLASIGLHEHPVVERGAAFLRDSVRENGSWPIDTNLATWVTTLSVNALAGGGGQVRIADEDGRRNPLRWLLNQQYPDVHPFTRAAPGGWAWTDLSGGVPDADDTSAALLALAHLPGDEKRRREAALRGVIWLLDLQNRDGGVPTFCRGWGYLPFDRSTPDITAHALRAWRRWREQAEESLQERLDQARKRALDYLLKVQDETGFWVPLWFGNHFAAGEANPVYGTGRVLSALTPDDVSPAGRIRRARLRAVRWLVSAQNDDGGWGGAPGAPSTVEETAVALEGLAVQLLQGEPEAGSDEAGRVVAAVSEAVRWLERRTEGGRRFPPSPVGLYFARLFYYEELYPLIFTVSALRHVALLSHPNQIPPEGPTGRE